MSELQSAPRDIAFDCPICRGHLVAQSSQIGTSADCPHCSKLLFIPKAPYVDDETELPGVRRILKRTKARISQPKLSHAPAPESIRPGGLIGAKSEAETTRVRLAAVEAELELERGSAATLIQMRSEIAVEREAAKRASAHAAELEGNLNRNQEHSSAAIAGLETRIEGLQKQLDTAILESRSVSLQLEEERESSQHSALEQQKLRDQLAQKGEAAQKAEATRLRLEAVEAELEKERGSAATLIQLRSEIAVERAAAKKSEAHAAELEENLNRNREDGIAAIARLETRIEGLQKQLDTAILEARSVSLQLEEQRESSRQSALEQQKLRDQLAEKSEAAQRAEARSAELETCLEQSVRDASAKVTALESQISDLRGQLDQSIKSRQSVEQQDQNLSVALGELESSALAVLRQLATRHNAPVGGEMNQRR